MHASACLRVGLCLTGCPYNLIYSASSTIKSLAQQGSIEYVRGRLALAVGEDADGPWLRTRPADGGPVSVVRADRLFVACGGLGTTQLVVNSARQAVSSLEMAEAVQFVLPFISRRGQPDPRGRPSFTLNQFSMQVEYGRPAVDLVHLHFYPYNPAFEDALPSVAARSELLRRLALTHTTAALGYLPSWDSPTMRVDFGDATGDALPEVRISSGGRPPGHHATLRKVVSRLLRVAPRLDLFPVLPMLRLSGPGKSYHFGGSFPHVDRPPRPGELETDSQGRLAEWRHVHLIDGSVFPNVPATTFTLTVMANAHRIAAMSLREPW
jgi:ferredoxin